MLVSSKPYVALLAALGLAACATTSASTSAANKIEETAALNAFDDCITKRAKALDDGKSDATTVALVVRSGCREQYGRWLAISARGLSPSAQQTFFRSMQGNDLEFAVKTVLAERRRTR